MSLVEKADPFCRYFARNAFQKSAFPIHHHEETTTFGGGPVSFIRLVRIGTEVLHLANRAVRLAGFAAEAAVPVDDVGESGLDVFRNERAQGELDFFRFGLIGESKPTA